MSCWSRVPREPADIRLLRAECRVIAWRRLWLSCKKMSRFQFVEERLYIAIDGDWIGASVAGEFANDLIDLFTLLEPVPHIAASGVDRQHSVALDIEDYCAIVIYDRPKMWSRCGQSIPLQNGTQRLHGHSCSRDRAELMRSRRHGLNRWF